MAGPRRLHEPSMKSSLRFATLLGSPLAISLIAIAAMPTQAAHVAGAFPIPRTTTMQLGNQF